MVTFDEYSRMVTAIHAAAITPEHWIDAMTTVRRSLDADACGMIIADGSSRLIKTASLPEEAKADYLDYYRDIDYVLEAVDKSPVGMINDGQELIALNARSEFNIDWMRPYDLQDGIFVRLTGEVDPTTFLLAAPLRDDAFATAERVRAINALIPHLQQALRTQNYLTGLQLEVDDLAAAIDSMRRAVLVLDAHAVVLHCNSPARDVLERNDGLSVRAGRLTSNSDDTALRRSVADATGAPPRHGCSVACQRLSGRPYVAHVTPFTAVDDDTPGRALVVIVDLDDPADPPAALLRRLYGLTGAECEVALRAGRGQGLAPIAEEMSLSMTTVKTHLHHVFAKTATRRQAELVRLLASLIP